MIYQILRGVADDRKTSHWRDATQDRSGRKDEGRNVIEQTQGFMQAGTLQK